MILRVKQGYVFKNDSYNYIIKDIITNKMHYQGGSYLKALRIYSKLVNNAYRY